MRPVTAVRASPREEEREEEEVAGPNSPHLPTQVITPARKKSSTDGATKPPMPRLVLVAW
jgi:hypothetical protein